MAHIRIERDDHETPEQIAVQLFSVAKRNAITVKCCCEDIDMVAYPIDVGEDGPLTRWRVACEAATRQRHRDDAYVSTNCRSMSHLRHNRLR